jgi:hypothetical protein
MLAMKFNNINILLLGITVILLSCKKEAKLNPIPSTLISDSNSFDNADRIAHQVNGLYASFKGSGFWGTSYIYYSEARSGDFVATNLNPTRGALSYMMTVDPGTSDVSSVWAQGYQIINACNVFLDGMEAKGRDAVGAGLGDNYIAEARLLRGLAYYYLLQLYADPYIKNQGASPGLPLRLTPNRGLSDYNLARSTVAEVYTQVLADLDFAEANLPDKYSSVALNATRAHKNTAISAKTKVYLSMGKYAQVITEGNKMVPLSAPYVAKTGVANGLQPDVTTVFKAPYTSAESIFSMPFTSNDAPGTSLGNAYLPDGQNATGFGKTGTGDYYLFEGGIVSDAGWKASDARRSFIFTTAAGVNKGRQWCVKYATGSPFTDYIPVIRYAEVLLNLAEALANENGLDLRALALVNAVRQRSDATTTITAVDKQDLINKIVNERHIEFFGEGIRNSDLMRLQLPVPAKTPIGSTPIPMINAGDPNYLWPIPNSESLYNKAL